MATQFKNKEGKWFTPQFFAVYYCKNGKTFKKVQDDINMGMFGDYDNVWRIELYKNYNDNRSADMIDRLDDR